MRDVYKFSIRKPTDVTTAAASPRQLYTKTDTERWAAGSPTARQALPGGRQWQDKPVRRQPRYPTNADT